MDSRGIPGRTPARGTIWDALVYDALPLNHSGEVCEAATANLFALIDGRLVTPSPESGSVLGVARGVLLELAASLQLASEQRRLSLREWGDATELFVTNSIVGVRPVTQVQQEGGDVLWTAATSEAGVTSRLAEAYALAVARECGER